MKLRDAAAQTTRGVWIGWLAMWPMILVVWLLTFGQEPFTNVVIAAFVISEVLALTRPWILLAWSHGWF